MDPDACKEVAKFLLFLTEFPHTNYLLFPLIFFCKIKLTKINEENKGEKVSPSPLTLSTLFVLAAIRYKHLKITSWVKLTASQQQ